MDMQDLADSYYTQQGIEEAKEIKKRRENLKVPGGWAGKGYTGNLWVKYKLTLEGFNAIWDAQGGKCAGCLTIFSHPTRRDMKMADRPEVDHCHEKGNVRGLLCRSCNDFLGKLKDNKDLLERLVKYLERNGDWK